jgi:hypothetical protein
MGHSLTDRMPPNLEYLGITYLEPSYNTEQVTTTRAKDGHIVFEDHVTGQERRYVDQPTTFDHKTDEGLHRPRALSMDDYRDVISDEELDALQASWEPDPEPDVHEFGSFVVDVCQGLSQNKAAEALADEFGGSKEKFRKMFHRGKLPIKWDGKAWAFTGEYRWALYEL